MSDADQIDERADPDRPEPPALQQVVRTSMADLKPKGACWYCNQPLDNVRRFCSKTCADDYRTEEEAFSSNGPA
jgi:hypothetical protein